MLFFFLVKITFSVSIIHWSLNIGLIYIDNEELRQSKVVSQERVVMVSQIPKRNLSKYASHKFKGFLK